MIKPKKKVCDPQNRTPSRPACDTARERTGKPYTSGRNWRFNERSTVPFDEQLRARIVAKAVDEWK